MEFRAWLDEIDAYVERLPAETFRESGTGVATRLIVATAEGTRTSQRQDEAASSPSAVRSKVCRGCPGSGVIRSMGRLCTRQAQSGNR